jgi:RNA polymerase sigma-70 factor (ECF subfamily)
MQEHASRLERAARGDQSAFAEIIREHQSMVYSLAYNYLRDRATAEEVAQEVFLHLYQSLPALESDAHVKHWLRRVACHRCIDASRRLKFRRHLSVDDLPEPAAREGFSDPLLARTLGRFIASLPERPRMIVTLRYQEDLDPAEIAEVLGMPVNTVKSHLRRALMLLREKVSRCLGEVHV